MPEQCGADATTTIQGSTGAAIVVQDMQQQCRVPELRHNAGNLNSAGEAQRATVEAHGATGEVLQDIADYAEGADALASSVATASSEQSHQMAVRCEHILDS